MISVRRNGQKAALRPVVSRLALGCEVLVPIDQSRLSLVHTAPPGSGAIGRLDPLGILGVGMGAVVQRLSANSRRNEER